MPTQGWEISHLKSLRCGPVVSTEHRLYTENRKRLCIKHIQRPTIESVSKPDSQFWSSACEKPKRQNRNKNKKRKHPKLWGIPGCKLRCCVFFLVSSCVRAGTRSFYGSLLLMFSKIDSILPGTHLACCLSLLSLLNTLVSLAPVGHEIIRGIQRHHWITFHASMILKLVFKNLKGNINYPLKAISHQ